MSRRETLHINGNALVGEAVAKTTEQLRVENLGKIKVLVEAVKEMAAALDMQGCACCGMFTCSRCKGIAIGQDALEAVKDA